MLQISNAEKAVSLEKIIDGVLKEHTRELALASAIAVARSVLSFDDSFSNKSHCFFMVNYADDIPISQCG